VSERLRIYRGMLVVRIVEVNRIWAMHAMRRSRHEATDPNDHPNPKWKFLADRRPMGGDVAHRND
jgi:hypothetical protein